MARFHASGALAGIRGGRGLAGPSPYRGVPAAFRTLQAAAKGALGNAPLSPTPQSPTAPLDSCDGAVPEARGGGLIPA